MYFDEIGTQLLPLTLLRSISDSLPTLKPLLTSFYFFKIIKSNLCCLYIQGCEAIHQGLVNLPGATTSKKIDLLFSISYQLSMAPQLGVPAHEFLPTANLLIDQTDLVQTTTASVSS